MSVNWKLVLLSSASCGIQWLSCLRMCWKMTEAVIGKFEGSQAKSQVSTRDTQ